MDGLNFLFLLPLNLFTIKSGHAADEVESITSFLDYFTRQYLPNCNSILLHDNSDYSNVIFSKILSDIKATNTPYQVWSMSEEMENIPWKLTSCDYYVFISEKTETLEEILSDSDLHWDWDATYIFICRDTDLDAIQAITSSYKSQRTSKMFIPVFLPETNEIKVIVNKLYADQSFEVLSRWSIGKKTLSGKPFADKVRNLNGKELVVFGFNFVPSIFAKVDEDGSLINPRGVDISIIEAVAHTLNFKPLFRHPGQYLWGDELPNGTTIGMLDKIKRGEGEIGVANVFIKALNAKHITFSTPYDYDQACFIAPAPIGLPRWLTVIIPFTDRVWNVVLATMVVLMLLIVFYASVIIIKDHKDFETLSGAFLVVISSFSKANHRDPRNTTLQVVIGTIIIVGFLVTNYYSSKLTSFLMVTLKEEPISTARQIQESDLSIGALVGWDAVFEDSAIPHIRKLSQKIVPISKLEKHIKDVISRKMVLIENYQHLEYLKKTFFTNDNNESPIRHVEECLYTFSIAAMLKPNSPLQNNIDMVMLRLRESGLILRYFLEALKEDHEEDFGFNVEEVIAHKEESKELSLEHLQGAFLVLAGGIGLSVLYLFLEMIFSQCCKKTT